MNANPQKIILLMSFAVILPLLAGCRTITYLTILDKQDRLELRNHNVPDSLYEEMVLREPLSLNEVVVLSKCQVSTNLLIRYLDTCGRCYHLTDEDVKWLRSQGVNQDLINHFKEIYVPVPTRILQAIGYVLKPN
jgi:hypothetical protein